MTVLQRQIDVYHLVPNTTYSFRVWATNQLGKGDIVEVEGHTHHSVEELGIQFQLFNIAQDMILHVNKKIFI